MCKKTCCLTGHRPMGFPWNYAMKNSILHIKYLRTLSNTVFSLIENGFNHFISGGAIGADQDFAECVIEFKKFYPQITLEIAVPCPHQDLRWKESDKQRYRNILKNADIVKEISPIYSKYCMHKRNKYMVDSSDFVIGVWNGSESGGTYHTLLYARKLNKDLKIIELNKLTF